MGNKNMFGIAQQVYQNKQRRIYRGDVIEYINLLQQNAGIQILRMTNGKSCEDTRRGEKKRRPLEYVLITLPPALLKRVSSIEYRGIALVGGAERFFPKTCYASLCDMPKSEYEERLAGFLADCKKGNTTYSDANDTGMYDPKTERGIENLTRTFVNNQLLAFDKEKGTVSFNWHPCEDDHCPYMGQNPESLRLMIRLYDKYNRILRVIVVPWHTCR